MRHRVVLLGCCLVVAGCMTQVIDRPQRDSGPGRVVDVSSIPEISPEPVTRTRAGNYSPYTVLGETYEVLETSHGFVEEGTASWYGSKFHGRLTSNGEQFDMYALTAAHKHLPIPTYAEVTNLENDRSIVVRINDRGPFHSSRNIDLSWAAAAKLGFAEQGTAKVKIVALDPDDPQATLESLETHGAPIPPVVMIPEEYVLVAGSYYQVARMAQKENANSFADEVESFTKFPVHIAQEVNGDSEHYRVLIGPLLDRREVNELSLILELAGMSRGFVVRLPHCQPADPLLDHSLSC